MRKSFYIYQAQRKRKGRKKADSYSILCVFCEKSLRLCVKYFPAFETAPDRNHHFLILLVCQVIYHLYDSALTDRAEGGAGAHGAIIHRAVNAFCHVASTLKYA